MSAKRGILGIALVLFLGATVLALSEQGYVGFFLAASANAATRLLLFDLVIALSLVASWMVRDARRHGHSVVPHLILTALFGAAGPLAYLLVRPWPRRTQRLAAVVLLVVLAAVAATNRSEAAPGTDAVGTPRVSQSATPRRAAAGG